MTNKSYLYSGFFHFFILGVLFWSPWFHPTGPIIWDIDFQGDGGGGGNGGTAGKGGPKAQEIGQVVPQPQQVSVPVKPAPIKPEIKATEQWKVKNPNEVKPPENTKVVPPPDETVEHGDKPQQETTNVIKRGVAPGTTAGDGSFDYGSGTGGGEGGGSGGGIGIGVGPGSGSGFGFGGYLRVVRNRLMQEWTQSAVFGKNQSCVVALTIGPGGMVRDIKLDKTSGNAFYDNVALRAVRNSSPLPPLPPNFPGTEQRFRIQFRLIE